MERDVRKERKWICDNCRSRLISCKLDDDTFMRIPSFTHCPICFIGTLQKQKHNDREETCLDCCNFRLIYPITKITHSSGVYSTCGERNIRFKKIENPEIIPIWCPLRAPKTAKWGDRDPNLREDR
jgi:hypothetical protein